MLMFTICVLIGVVFICTFILLVFINNCKKEIICTIRNEFQLYNACAIREENERRIKDYKRSLLTLEEARTVVTNLKTQKEEHSLGVLKLLDPTSEDIRMFIQTGVINFKQDMETAYNLSHNDYIIDCNY